MSGRTLDRFVGRASELVADASAGSEPDGAEDLGVFGWLRGTRDQSVMLELRKKTGDILAIAYGWIRAHRVRSVEGNHAQVRRAGNPH